MSKVSVIIPTFNKSEYLDLTLASFCNQTYNDFEIIVIDDGSTDSTKEVVDYYKDKINIKYLFHENQGRAASRNVGILEAGGDYIIFNDDDRLVSSQYIQAHVNSLDSGSEKTVVVGWKHNIISILRNDILWRQADIIEFIKKNPELINNLSTEKPIALIKASDLEGNSKSIVEKYSMHDEQKSFFEFFNKYGDNLSDFHFKWLVGTTANMSVKKHFLTECGLFDENYKGWGMEDTDLFYRLINHGGDMIINRYAINFHQIHPRETGISLTKKLRKNVIYFVEKLNNLDAFLFYRWSKHEISLNEADKLLSLAKQDEGIMAELTNLYGKIFHNFRES